MKRRKLMLSLGAAAAGGAAVTGTGAFSAVSATRDVQVNLAGDADAYLRIAPSSGPNGAYATGATDGALALDFTSSNDNVPGDGLNRDAISYFDDVFVVENHGTQPVELTMSPISFVELEPAVILVVLLVPLSSPAFTGGTLPEFGTDPEDADITFGLTSQPLAVGSTARYGVLAASYEFTSPPNVGFSDEISLTAEAI